MLNLQHFVVFSSIFVLRTKVQNSKINAGTTHTRDQDWKVCLQIFKNLRKCVKFTTFYRSSIFVLWTKVQNSKINVGTRRKVCLQLFKKMRKCVKFTTFCRLIFNLWLNSKINVTKCVKFTTFYRLLFNLCVMNESTKY